MTQWRRAQDVHASCRNQDLIDVNEPTPFGV
jgi:hypothetical protein